MSRCNKLSTTIIIFGFLATILSLVQCFTNNTYDRAKYGEGLFATSGTYNIKQEPCMGKCYGKNNNFCQIGRTKDDVGTDCKLSKKFVARRYTVYGSGTTQLCLSDCGKFKGNSNPWCVTDNAWFPCTTEIPQKVIRKSDSENDIYPCKEPCDPSKGWCDTLFGSKQKCKPDKIVYIADNPTEKGTKCVTRCGATDAKLTSFKCYDTKNNRVLCYPSPNAIKIVKAFHNYAIKSPFEIDKEGKLSRCKRTYSYLDDNKVRLLSDDDDDVTIDQIDTLQLESIFNGINTVEQMATEIAFWYPVETLRWPDPNVYPDPSTEPIIEYAVRIVPAQFGQPQTILPMMTRAIYSANTRPTGNRTSRYDEGNYARQNPRTGRDDHGHLISHALGGPDDAFNIVPQSIGLNRGGSWSYLERTMRGYLDNNPRGTIEHTIVVNYDFTRTYRPTCFAIRVRFYNANRQLVNQYGHRLASFADNIYENFYLINEDTPCGRG